MPAQTVIKLRRSTAAQWTSANPVLGAGEPGLETDTNKVKFGDGTTAWNSLAYSVTSDIEVAVKNSTAVTITKGSVVYISGADGNNPTISLAQANSEMTSSKTLGFVKADIAVGATGTVVTEGMLDGLNTNAAPNAGDPIWLSPTTAGGVVYGLANKPVAPNHMVFLGYVVRKQTNNGRIYIKVQNGYELDELHDVSIAAPTTGQVLQYDGSTSVWKNNGLTISSVSNLQSSLDGKQATITGAATTVTSSNLTASRALASDGSGKIAVSSVTSTELGHLSGVTSAVQTQLDGKAATSHTHTMSSLTDFNISSPTNGQTLTYNASTGKWVNSAAASGGETISSFLLMGA